MYVLKYSETIVVDGELCKMGNGWKLRVLYTFLSHHSRSQLNVHIILHLEGNCGRVVVYA